MIPDFFGRGLLLGLLIAAPVGPIGVLCIRRTLASGAQVGILSGLGAATADALYGAVAAFGLTAVSRTLVAGQTWMAMVGGAFLLWLGVQTLLGAGKTREEARPALQGAGLAAAFASTLALTLTNPMTILSFAAVFAGMGLATRGGDALSAAWLVAGVFLGSAAWWLMLCGVVSRLRAGFDARAMRAVNYVSGGVLVVFGALALARSLGWK